jgi:hypothetical protein
MSSLPGTSEFYFACRNNQIEEVHRILENQTLDVLDRMEPNESTALHAACYYGNEEIVELLLNRGFTRCVINKYNNTPIDEAKNKRIEQLFIRPTVFHRFVEYFSSDTRTCQWTFIDINTRAAVRQNPVDPYDGNRLHHGLFHADRIHLYLGETMPKIDVIQRLFRRAIYERACSRLVQAYTAETLFYNRVNDYLLSWSQASNQDRLSQSNPMSEFVDTIRFNHQLHSDYAFQGRCYRCMKMRTIDDVKMFQVNRRLINRTFLSTTSEFHLAKEYLVNDDSMEYPLSAVFSFEIRSNKTALNIERLSEFPHEHEILIMNETIFKVTRCNRITHFYWEIDLRQSRAR